MLALLPGCIRSKVVVTSTPPGADVTMNEVNLGQTPAEMPFTWWWYYDFKATKEGFEPASARERFRNPWYMEPPLDLVCEALPFPIYETQHVHFDLKQVEQRPAPEFVEPAAPAPVPDSPPAP